MDKYGAKDLLGDVEEPDLEGTLRPLPPALVDEREQGQSAERALDEEGERSQ